MGIFRRTFSDTSQAKPLTSLRNMPSWLMLAPWFVVACSLFLALLVLMLDFRGGHRESQITTRIFLERGSSLIHAFESTLQTGMGFQWTDEELQSVLDTLATSPDIHYMAVTDEAGHVLAASQPAMVGTELVTPEAMRELGPSKHADGRLVEFSFSGDKPARIFQVCQQISVRQYGERLRQHGHENARRRMHQNMQCSTTSQNLVVFVGYDLTPLVAAQEADARQAFVHWTVLIFIAAVGILTLFLVKGYQKSRLLVQETTAFTYALIDTLPLGIIAVDSQGLITTFNPEAERITGQRDALGRVMKDALPGLWAVLSDSGLLEQDQPKELELRCVFGQERRIPLAVTAAAIIAEDVRHAGHTFILRDLGEIRRLEAEIRRQDRLAALGNMAAGIAHEIRNPLGAIKGLARFFRESFEDDTQEARMADIMTQEVQRLDGVVGDLLELARPDTLNPVLSSPLALLERAQGLVQADMDAKGIRYSLDVSALPDVPLDPDRMTQVLLNLYLNSVQAMPHGGELRVRAWLDATHTNGAELCEAGSSLIIEIQDTGEGIPKEKLSQIFSPYYTTKAHGTGLGLSLVHKIVEAHDGEIDVKSVPGQGSTFTLRLPLPVRRGPSESQHA